MDRSRNSLSLRKAITFPFNDRPRCKFSSSKMATHSFQVRFGLWSSSNDEASLQWLSTTLSIVQKSPLTVSRPNRETQRNCKIASLSLDTLAITSLRRDCGANALASFV